MPPGDHWLTSSCTVRVHRSGSSCWSRSSIFLLQKLRISWDMTRLIRRSSATSLADLTRSLSLDTGKPRSLVVAQISIALSLLMDFVHLRVGPWPGFCTSTHGRHSFRFALSLRRCLWIDLRSQTLWLFSMSKFRSRHPIFRQRFHA